MHATPKSPYVVGIAGGTGSGKTTVAETLLGTLPEGSATIISHDAYYRHRPELSAAERDAINFDHPDALEHTLLLTHLDALQRGEAVQVPIYDFAAHLRSGDTVHQPAVPIVIVEGILCLTHDGLRERMDMRVFVDTAADVRILRRLHRDLLARGRSVEQVRSQYQQSVRPMHETYVEPSKRHAHVIIPGEGDIGVAIDLLGAKLRSMLGEVSEPTRPARGD